jgi:hypothetical protein
MIIGIYEVKTENSSLNYKYEIKIDFDYGLNIYNYELYKVYYDNSKNRLSSGWVNTIAGAKRASMLDIGLKSKDFKWIDYK